MTIQFISLVGIKAKLVLAFAAISSLTVLMAFFAIGQDVRGAHAAARLEAEHVAMSLAYTGIDDVIVRQPEFLVSYVKGLHAIHKRDLTIVGLDQIGVADSDVPDVGNAYVHDLRNEVGDTLKDGVPRHFIEVSPLFPEGTREVVVAMRRDGSVPDSPIIGALILEYGPIHEELMAAATSRSRLVFLAAALAVVFAVSSGVFLARRLTKPLSELTRAATDFAAGQFERRVDYSGRNELGVLAGAFNIMAEELAERNLEITLFGKLNQYLQASDSEAEAYSVIVATAKQLFPNDSGAVFAFSASRNMVEANAVWGAAPPSAVIFQPNQCWALQRGQAHLGIDNEMRCRHVDETCRTYACIPLAAQGESLGILHIACTGSQLQVMEKYRVAKAFAETMGIALANLKLRDAMRALSIRDPLTGLFNRRYMEEALAQELHRARRVGTQVAAIMIDIDHFKRFNDEFGHDAGDAVLRALGPFFQSHVRGGDTACRFGGEEFIIILSPTTTEGAHARAIEICEKARAVGVMHANRSLGAITLSLGVALFPDAAATAEELVKAADVALYRAKRAGRDRVVASGTDHVPENA